ncbi:glycosyltransferase family 4 protein [Aerococcus viridans]|uniref:glycosyltransferase family 4 protein n=1 Tax=Aerococcus viridans TaxID=1377 RepID=UPI003B20FEEE
MKKALMVASVASMIRQFNMENIKVLQELGYKVTVATNFNGSDNEPKKSSNELMKKLERMGVNTIQIDMDRLPLKFKNYKAYSQLKKNINENKYDLIHCQSPVGGVLTRLAAINKKAKVIYTAHGFHFFKGAPRKNWLIFYSLEKVLSYFTDILITINNEDYQRAKKEFHAKKTVYIPGVGINTEKFSQNNLPTTKIREELNINKDDFLLMSVGEINENKNHEIIIRALANIDERLIKFAIIGIGSEKERLELLSQSLEISDRILFLGYKNNVKDYLSVADAFVFPSKREGLGLAALEAMASGLPIVTSNVHGIKDYSENGVTGFTFNPHDLETAIKAINNMYNLDEDEKNKMKNRNKKIAQKFDISNVNQAMKEIYEYDI